jgi:hypothetical protein
MGGAEVVGVVVLGGNVVVDPVVVVASTVVVVCIAGTVEDAATEDSLGSVITNDRSCDSPHAAINAKDRATSAFEVRTSEQSAMHQRNLMPESCRARVPETRSAFS